jgi:hypothetical protein
LLETVAIGRPLILMTIDAGDQGAAITGVQGIGVSTPSAAAVALATAGFAWLEHIPNGSTFAGVIWTMVAAGSAPMISGEPGSGSATKADGAAPKLHVSNVPVTSGSGIARLRYRNSAFGATGIATVSRARERIWPALQVFPMEQRPS